MNNCLCKVDPKTICKEGEITPLTRVITYNSSETHLFSAISWGNSNQRQPRTVQLWRKKNLNFAALYPQYELGPENLQ